MKKIFSKLTLAIGLGLVLGMSSSCSDDHMTDVNTDDTKMATIDPNSLLTTGILQTYGDFDMMDTYRCYITGFTQYYSGGYNVATFAGSNMYNNEYSRKLWDKLYGVGIKNLVEGERITANTKNLNAAIRIYKVYLLSLLTDCYGDIPCKEAGLGSAQGISYPTYDTQDSIYSWFFTELKACTEQLGTGSDKISGDPSSMGGNTDKWIKFANSLRMRFAMRLSDVNPEKAKAEFVAAIEANGGYITSQADDAYVKYLKKPFTLYDGASDLDFRVNALSEMLYGQDPQSPTFVCKTLYKKMEDTQDPRLYRICRCYINTTRSEVAAEGVYDVTDEIIAWGIEKADGKSGVQPNEVGEAWWCAWPSIPDNKDIPTLERLVKENPNAGYDKNNYPARMTRPALAIEFEQADCPGILFTSAEAEFLLAEAAYRGWISDNVDAHYEAGVRASMDILNSYYKVNTISKTEVDDFLALNPVGTNPIETINTQAWILHLTNPIEGWANLRRSDYPRICDRRTVPTESSMKLGESQENLIVPVRLRYPTLEEDNNKTQYAAATQRQLDKDGQYSWHSNVWWDKHDIKLYDSQTLEPVN